MPLTALKPHERSGASKQLPVNVSMMHADHHWSECVVDYRNNSDIRRLWDMVKMVMDKGGVVTLTSKGNESAKGV